MCSLAITGSPNGQGRTWHNCILISTLAECGGPTAIKWRAGVVSMLNIFRDGYLCWKCFFFPEARVYMEISWNFFFNFYLEYSKVIVIWNLSNIYLSEMKKQIQRKREYKNISKGYKTLEIYQNYFFINFHQVKKKLTEGSLSVIFIVSRFSQ